MDGGADKKQPVVHHAEDDEASSSSGAPEHAFDTGAPRFDRCPW